MMDMDIGIKKYLLSVCYFCAFSGNCRGIFLTHTCRVMSYYQFFWAIILSKQSRIQRTIEKKHLSHVKVVLILLGSVPCIQV